MPLEFMYAVLLYAGMECMYSANAGIVLWRKGEKGWFDPERYDGLVGMYVAAARVMAVMSPLIFFLKYRAVSTALMETPKTPPTAPPAQ